MNALWEDSHFRTVSGNAWRPGGIALTRHALDWCKAQGLLAPRAIAVDMGYGGGATLDLLASYGLQSVGLDIRAGLDTAHDSPSAQNCLRADVTHPPLAASSVDVIVFECVLSLLEDPLAALHASSRILTPGGLLLVSDITRAANRALPQPSKGMDSCVFGAQTVERWRQYLCACGVHILLQEDHSRALVDLAARLLWYGVAEHAFPWQRVHCFCKTAPHASYGYYLWIARKEEPCIP